MRLARRARAGGRSGRWTGDRRRKAGGSRAWGGPDGAVPEGGARVIDTVALLLADRSPSLRFRALVEVDGLPLDDPEVAALSSELASSDVVDRVISATPQDLHWMSFALCRLDYLGLARGHPAVDSLAEKIFDAQRKDGSWPY